MEVITTKDWVNREIKYGFLTEAEVKDLDLTLDKDQVIISHVGDGEYSHNIFGNVFTNYSEALASFKKSFSESRWHPKADDLSCIILKCYPEFNSTDYYVGYVRADYKTADKVYPQLIGLLTVERLNSEFKEGS